MNAVEDMTRDRSQERCVRADGSEKSCVRAEGLQKSCVRSDRSEKSDMSCVRVDGWTKSCVRADESEKSYVQAEESSSVGVWNNGGAEIIANNQRNRNCQDSDVKLIVRDPLDDDKIPVVSGAQMAPLPHEPSEFEKIQTSAHSHPISTMVHIMRQRQSTSGTTQTNRARYRRQRTPSNTMRLSPC